MQVPVEQHDDVFGDRIDAGSTIALNKIMKLVFGGSPFVGANKITSSF
jgi:hypothetical protein